jgi:molybdopterin molybdotransferase
VLITVISSGGELVEPGAQPSVGQLFDCNRHLLLALLAKPSVVTDDGGCHRDDPDVLADVLKSASRTADIVLITGGTADGDEDHTSRAILVADGEAQRLRIALKPGKPSIVGRLGNAVVIGLPGNPIAALVSFLLLGQSTMDTLVGRRRTRPRGLPAVSAGPYRHVRGRTEFVPARVLSSGSDRFEIEILGRGGSARFAPLLSADGLVEIASSMADLAVGGQVRFHPFSAVGCL